MSDETKNAPAEPVTWKVGDEAITRHRLYPHAISVRVRLERKERGDDWYVRPIEGANIPYCVLESELERVPAEPLTGRIAGPAIRKDGKVWSVPIPASHYSVSLEMSRFDCVEPLKGEQGFVTTTGRYVDRREARVIASAAGQIVNPITGSDDLFSEELRLPTPQPATESASGEVVTRTWREEHYCTRCNNNDHGGHDPARGKFCRELIDGRRCECPRIATPAHAEDRREPGGEVCGYEACSLPRAHIIHKRAGVVVTNQLPYPLGGHTFVEPTCPHGESVVLTGGIRCNGCGQQWAVHDDALTAALNRRAEAPAQPVTDERTHLTCDKLPSAAAEGVE